MNKTDYSPEVFQSVFDSMKTSICLLDDKGTIIWVNRAWLAFAKENNAKDEKIGENCNYIEVCDQAEGQDAGSAKLFAAGIRSVIKGEKDFFELEYPCHSPYKKRWYQGRATSFTMTTQTPSRNIIITHEDITAKKLAENALRERLKELMCLQEISRITIKSDLSLENILTHVAEIIPSYWQYMEIACARITIFDDNTKIVFTGQRFNETKWFLKSNIVSSGNNIGQIEVFYQEEKPEIDEGPFLKEERNLIDAIANLLSNVIRQKQYEEELRYLSSHDQLTGLYNRFYLEEEMERLDKEKKLPTSIVMGDLNGLKLVNDTYGHTVGDKMLKIAAEVIRDSCRKTDIVSRWGGDEFVIIMPQTSDVETKDINKRIMENCQRVHVKDIPISLALGTATKAHTDQNLFEVLKEAEDDMYRQKLAEDRSTKSAVLNTLLRTLGTKSFETETHIERMLEIAEKIGEKLELPESELNRLNLLITLHDIGKINIPEEILTKEDSFTDQEWVIMKKHTEIGYRIALASEEFAHVAEDVLAHHERWDGHGYPRGLKGEEIPFLARIAAIVDAYEVMTNGRQYQNIIDPNEIIAEFEKCAGTHFDPELVRLFITILKEDVNW